MNSEIFSLVEVDSHLSFGVAQYIGSFNDYHQQFQDNTTPSQPSPASLNASYNQLKTNLWDMFRVHYQIFDSTMILNIEQIKWALFHSNAAFKQGTNISKTPNIEFLLYLSAQRQISVAFEKCGISLLEKDAIVENSQKKIQFGEILFGNPPNVELATLYLMNKEKKKIYENEKSQKSLRYPLPTISATQLCDFISYYQISIPQILNALHNYDLIPSSILFSQEKPDYMTISKLQSQITIEDMNKAIIESYNMNLVNLYITSLHIGAKK